VHQIEADFYFFRIIDILQSLFTIFLCTDDDDALLCAFDWPDAIGFTLFFLDFFLKREK
jgi:hypothetical protein